MLIQIAQWMSMSGLNEQMPKLFADDFDPKQADPNSEPVRLALGTFESDRIRDAILQRVDLRVLRVTGDRLDNHPRAVIDDVLALRR